MAKVEDIIEKMKRSPSGISYREGVKVLRSIGYERVRHTGSHSQFRNAAGLVTTVKKENPLDKGCVKDILRRVGE